MIDSVSFEERQISTTVRVRHTCQAVLSATGRRYPDSGDLPSFRTKQLAKKWACKSLLEEQGHNAETLATDATPSQPGGSVGQQLLDLCEALDLIVPTFIRERSANANNVWSGHPEFHNSWPLVPPSNLGVVVNVVGKEVAKKKMQSEVISWLKDNRHAITARRSTPAQDENLADNIQVPAATDGGGAPLNPVPTGSTMPNMASDMSLSLSQQIDDLCKKLGLPFPQQYDIQEQSTNVWNVYPVLDGWPASYTPTPSPSVVGFKGSKTMAKEHMQKPLFNYLEALHTEQLRKADAFLRKMD